jgi:alanyl-tRNA synthetase
MFFFDQESWDIWKELISEDQIILGNKKDNFGKCQGDQRSGGPCSENSCYELKKKKALVLANIGKCRPSASSGNME